jgi:hypothetical protein
MRFSIIYLIGAAAALANAAAIHAQAADMAVIVRCFPTPTEHARSNQ